MDSSMREHGAIVRAILDEDPEAAGQALRAHIDSSSANAMRYYLEHRAAAGKGDAVGGEQHQEGA